MKITFKTLLMLTVIGTAAATFTSCEDPKENVITPVVEKEVVITSNITTNTTWTKDKVYILGSRIAVVSGVTLTIEPGTVIKGKAGSGPNATALIIARGAKLMAEGTATAPIIFTSTADEIVSGQIASPNMDPTLQGLWGGLIVLGNAPASLAGGVQETQIEGIPASDPNGKYGGTNVADNSGVLKYISIRHGGANIGEGNEINGLTLGGVGNGTVVQFIEVVGNQDDGIEFFGGSVNVSNAVVWNSGDDAIDTDQAWSGTLDNFAIVCGAFTDHALEIDGPEGPTRAGHTVKNGTIKGHPVSEMADFRAGAEGNFSNLYFFSFPSPLATATSGRGDFSLDAATVPNFTAGSLIFSSLQTTLPADVALTDVFKNGTSVHAANVNPRTVGANVSLLNSWSWSGSGATSALTGF